MKPSAIYLDMDGVLVDFVGGVMEFYGLNRNLRERVMSWDGIPALLTELLPNPVTDEQLWSNLESRGRSEFWRNLEWLPWGQELYTICAAFAPTVLMSTPTHAPSSASGKLEWIRQNIPEEGQRRYSLSPCKHHMAHPGALLVDDSQSNVDKFREHGGDAILIPAPWNSEARWPEAHEVIDLVLAQFEARKEG